MENAETSMGTPGNQDEKQSGDKENLHKDENTPLADHQTEILSSWRIFSAILNGLGVGLLLGLMLGLAVSAVVSGVIGTLSSILVVLLGLNDKHITTLKSLRIGSFGVFAVAGILFGVYIRTTDALSKSTNELKDEFISAGFSKDQALYYVALKKFKYVPVGWFGTSLADTAAMSTTDNFDKSVLFSSDVDLSQCRILNTADSTFPKSEIFNTFQAAGGVWEKLAIALEPELPGQVYVDGLLGIRDSFCALGSSGNLTVEGTPGISGLSTANNTGEIISALQKAGGNWLIILENTKQKIPDKFQSKFYLTVIKTLSNEDNH